MKLLGSNAMTEPDMRAKFLEQAAGINWTAKGALSNLYVNSILSAQSALKKVASDMANIPWQILTRSVAQTFSRGPMETGTITYAGQPAESYAMRVAPGEAQVMLRSVTEGWGEAWENALAAWRTGAT